jgi:RNA polymerase sigma factor (sigma-70 family)
MSVRRGTERVFSAGGVMQPSRDAASEVASRIRESREASRDCRDDEALLLKLMRPLLVKEARAVPSPGSVQSDDLEQEGALVVLSCCSRFLPEGPSFVAYAQPLVRRAMRDFALRQSQDVRPSHRAQRGLTQWRPVACVLGSLSAGDASAAAWQDAVEQANPVSDAEATLLDEEQKRELLRVVGLLEDEHRYLLERHYGLRGFDPTSSRELARVLGVSRTSTDGILARAVDRLREMLSDAPHAS